MIRKLSKGVSVVVISFVLLLFSSQAAYAQVNIEQLQGVINGLITPQQMNEVKKPFLADRNEISEIVDPMTGSLTLKQTDLNLSGKDGLDLSIARIYN
ncbi:MAG TPA: hypothetical protein DD791_10525, partial [Syntrophomonas sp.]|nr:hypothetical protein [Syntrophomonas sp.]